MGLRTKLQQRYENAVRFMSTPEGIRRGLVVSMFSSNLAMGFTLASAILFAVQMANPDILKISSISLGVAFYIAGVIYYAYGKRKYPDKQFAVDSNTLFIMFSALGFATASWIPSLMDLVILAGLLWISTIVQVAANPSLLAVYTMKAYEDYYSRRWSEK